MAKRIVNYLGDHALAAVALGCSLLALAGSSYAAFTISGTQIRNHSIDPVKLNPRFIAGNVRAWARVGADGHVVAGSGVGAALPPNEAGLYAIDWKPRLSAKCATVASIDANPSESTEVVNGTRFVAGYASAETGLNTGGHSRYPSSSSVQTFNQAGQPTALPFNLVVIC